MKKGGIGPVVMVGVIAAAITACAGGDTSLFVNHESGQAWSMSVPRKDRDYSRHWVVKVQPRANAFALSWDGGPEVAVTVLALDCSPVGVFQIGEDGEYVVDAVPGLTARIQNTGAPLGSRSNDPGVEDTEDCGGELFK